jgi:hypothetical protein
VAVMALCYKIRMRTSVLVLLTCCLILPFAMAQSETPVLPTVTSFACPKYPSNAESTRLQGMVKMQVTTNGHEVTDVKITSGHPVLAQAADKSVRTWKFKDHTPTTFAVTYFYVFQGYVKRDPVTKCSAKMDLPTQVTISTKLSFP